MVVDNFGPYVVRTDTALDTESIQLRSGGGSAAVLRIEIEFSEPLQDAEIVAIHPTLGVLPALEPTSTGKNRWVARVAVPGDFPTGPRLLAVRGTDTAGNQLLPRSPWRPRLEAAARQDARGESQKGGLSWHLLALPASGGK